MVLRLPRQIWIWYLKNNLNINFCADERMGVYLLSITGNLLYY